MTTLTDFEIKKAIKALQSMDTVVDYDGLNRSIAWLHPQTRFLITHASLCEQAKLLNQKINKDIFDKRTRGYKLIKEEYLKSICEE